MTITDEDEEVRASVEVLEARMVELSSQIAGATCELLLLVGEYDAAEGWRSWGVSSTSAWLSWQCGVGRTAAREQVRVARALRKFPQIVEPFRRGRLSYSKVRAISRVATEATIETLVDWALHATAAQIERIVSGRRRDLRSAEARALHTSRSLSWRWDDDGSLLGSFRLPPEQAARFLQAIEVARGVLPDLPEEVEATEVASAVPRGDLVPGAPASTDLDRSLAADAAATPQRTKQRSAADALMEMAERAVAAIEADAAVDDDGLGLPGLGAERFTLVMHSSASAEAAKGTSGRNLFAEVMAGDGVVGLPSVVTRRLSCDCSYSVQTDDANGNPLHLGRKTRRIRGRLARAVHARDGGRCQAPGCTNRTTQIHHIVHWADGGLTCVENLISLCDRHHWLVHEGGWSVRVVQQGWVFRSPEGMRLATHPEPAPAVVPLPRNNTIAADAVAATWGPARFDINEALVALDLRDRRGIPSAVNQ
ncbi:MAG TPA: DUF222 domain-containing protein [Mycobacteriales bacterium]|nr:DUF222 domain-containing protein [Mycobacteriales bacterium]